VKESQDIGARRSNEWIRDESQSDDQVHRRLCHRPLPDDPARSEIGARSVVLFVLGPGRSGTSALTRVLSLCGAALPAAMLGADHGNPRGYWAPRATLHLNASILRRHNSSTLDPRLRLQEEGAFDAEEKAACIAKIRGYLTTLPAAPVVIIKDPQITLLSSMWFQAALDAGFDVSAIIPVRHPHEVIASWSSFIGATPELANALWLKSSLLAERRTRAVPRVFVEYNNLVDNWRREVKRISTALAIDLATRDEDAIEEFLTPDFLHQHDCSPVTELPGTHWNSSVYEVLHAAARDEPCDESVLDGVFEEYRTMSEHFWTALEDFSERQHSVRRRLIRPSIGRAIAEVRATAHRRSGTWA
jgi:hypothetical protein